MLSTKTRTISAIVIASISVGGVSAIPTVAQAQDSSSGSSVSVCEDRTAQAQMFLKAGIEELGLGNNPAAEEDFEYAKTYAAEAAAACSAARVKPPTRGVVAPVGGISTPR
jgi:hypothetical protein